MKRTLAICVIIVAMLLLASQLFALGYPSTGYNSSSTRQNQPGYNSVRALDHHPHQFNGDETLQVDNISPDNVTPVPEPTTWILMTIGLVVFGLAYKLRS